MIILNPLTRKNIAKVLSETLNANYPLNLHNRIINDMLWAITCDSDDGKKDGLKYSQAYWTNNAIKRRNNNLLNNTKKDYGLRHEHIVPKNLIRKILNNLQDVNQHQILQIINHYNHAVIVSIEEDSILRKNGFQKKLPNGYNLDNYDKRAVFSRYIESEIALFKVNIFNNEVIIDYPKLIFKNNNYEIIED
tara:strand:- start:35 stop:610 length:576 start_codon:yes stop_codon:yes gene_type:complete